MNWERLREKLLEKYYPEEEELEKATRLYSKLSGYIEEEHGLSTHFAGSTGRRTCMTGDKDIDLFVLFPENTERNELESRGLEIGKEVFKKFDGDSEISYAEHPYTKGEIEGHEVEIVPCIDTSPEDITSSVDRTPHHSRWVEDQLSDEQRKDVVLFKRFLTAQDLYGSSLKIKGFSGYLAEILVAHYGSFRELMEKAEHWREGQVIDAEGHHEELPEYLQEKFSDELFRVIDPVDEERNVASVMSDENFSRFIYEAWRFNRSPGMKFFTGDKIDISNFDLKQELDSRADFLVIQLDEPDAVEDVIYPQMRKTLRRLGDELKHRDFRIYSSGFHVGEKVRIYFELDAQLPEVKLKEGPKPFHGAKHIDQFTSKYENTFVRDTSLYAKVEREYTDARNFLVDFTSSDPEQLRKKGIPEHISTEMSSSRFVDPVQDDERWLKFLAEQLHVNNDE